MTAAVLDPRAPVTARTAPLGRLLGSELRWVLGRPRTLVVLGVLALIPVLVAVGVPLLAAIALAVSSLTEHPLVVLAAVLGGLIVFGVLTALPALDWLEPYLLTSGWTAGSDVLRDPLPWNGLVQSSLRALCYAAVGAGV